MTEFWNKCDAWRTFVSGSALSKLPSAPVLPQPRRAATTPDCSGAIRPGNDFFFAVIRNTLYYIMLHLHLCISCVNVNP